MVEDLLSERNANALSCQNVVIKPNANREPDNVSEGKGVGYFTEKLQVCNSLLWLFVSLYYSRHYNTVP